MATEKTNSSSGANILDFSLNAGNLKSTNNLFDLRSILLKRDSPSPNEPDMPIKSSNEILSELFGAFNAEPPKIPDIVISSSRNDVLGSENHPDESPVKKSKKSKKKHKHKEKKHRKRDKSKIHSTEERNHDSVSRRNQKRRHKCSIDSHKSKRCCRKHVSVSLLKDESVTVATAKTDARPVMEDVLKVTSENVVRTVECVASEDTFETSGNSVACVQADTNYDSKMDEGPTQTGLSSTESAQCNSVSMSRLVPDTAVNSKASNSKPDIKNLDSSKNEKSRNHPGGDEGSQQIVNNTITVVKQASSPNIEAAGDEILNEATPEPYLNDSYNAESVADAVESPAEKVVTKDLNVSSICEASVQAKQKAEKYEEGEVTDSSTYSSKISDTVSQLEPLESRPLGNVQETPEKSKVKEESEDKKHKHSTKGAGDTDKCSDRKSRHGRSQSHSHSHTHDKSSRKSRSRSRDHKSKRRKSRSRSKSKTKSVKKSKVDNRNESKHSRDSKSDIKLKKDTSKSESKSKGDDKHGNKDKGHASKRKSPDKPSESKHKDKTRSRSRSREGRHSKKAKRSKSKSKERSKNESKTKNEDKHDKDHTVHKSPAKLSDIKQKDRESSRSQSRTRKSVEKSTDGKLKEKKRSRSQAAIHKTSDKSRDSKQADKNQSRSGSIRHKSTERPRDGKRKDKKRSRSNSHKSPEKASDNKASDIVQNESTEKLGNNKLTETIRSRSRSGSRKSPEKLSNSKPKDKKRSRSRSSSRRSSEKLSNTKPKDKKISRSRSRSGSHKSPEKLSDLKLKDKKRSRSRSSSRKSPEKLSDTKPKDKKRSRSRSSSRKSPEKLSNTKPKDKRRSRSRSSSRKSPEKLSNSKPKDKKRSRSRSGSHKSPDKLSDPKLKDIKRSRSRSSSLKSPETLSDLKPKDKKRSRSRSKDRHSKKAKRSRSKSGEKSKDSHTRKSEERSSRRRKRSRSGSASRAKRRSRSGSSNRIDKKKLLEIARKNAMTMLKQGSLPGSVVTQDKVVAIKAGGKSVEELTDFCKQLSKKEAMEEESDSGDGPRSTDSDTERPFHHPFQIKERPPNIVLNIRNSVQLPVKTLQEKTAEQSKQLRIQFPVSSGQQHRKTENEWIPVSPKKEEQAALAAASQVDTVANNGGVFPNTSAVEGLDIGSIVSQRLTAMRRLQENPNDVQALKDMYRAQKDMQMWAESKQQPGQFTGSTGVRVLSAAELSSGFQAWAKKDQLKEATPVSGGMGMTLLQKMGWKPGEGLGKNKEGTLIPLQLEVKVDKKGLVSQEELVKPPPQQLYGHHKTNLADKHPVSLLVSYCSRRRWSSPQFELCFECGPDHKKNFLFKVVVNGVEYKPSVASPNKKLAKAEAATVCLQALGLLAP